MPGIWGDGQRGGIFGAKVDPRLLAELERRAAQKRAFDEQVASLHPSQIPPREMPQSFGDTLTGTIGETLYGAPVVGPAALGLGARLGAAGQALQGKQDYSQALEDIQTGQEQFRRLNPEISGSAQWAGSGLFAPAFGGSAAGQIIGNAALGGADAAVRGGDPSLAAVAGGGIAGALHLPAIFGGVMARTANHEMLALARKLKAEGAAPSRIWEETGWFKAPDGNWKFEISDEAAKFVPSTAEPLGRIRLAQQRFTEQTGVDPIKFSTPKWSAETSEALKWVDANMDRFTPSTPLGEVLVHPELYAAYPELANISTKPEMRGGGTQGSFSKDRITYGGSERVGEPLDNRSTLLHEGQHAVQDIEGFARGGSPSQFIYQNDPLFKQRKSYERPEDAYRRLAGEVEARNVQQRMDLTAEQRRVVRPWWAQDVPTEQQIFNYDVNGPQASIKAYHASPHDFERFDASKIGTGQGAQSFGHGIYVAENPRVSGRGGSYDREFTAKKLGQSDTTPQQEYILNQLDAGASDLDILKGLAQRGGTDFEQAQGMLDTVKANRAKIYEVDIAADPEHFLDWDKPLSEQSPQVREQLHKGGVLHGDLQSEMRQELSRRSQSTDEPMALQNWYEELRQQAKTADDDALDRIYDQQRVIEQWWDEGLGSENKGSVFDPTGEAIHRQIAERLTNAPNIVGSRNQPDASQILREAGIPGIKYLDQGSRVDPQELATWRSAVEQYRAQGDTAKLATAEKRLADLERRAKEGTSNFVVFDDRLISILKKYGLPISAAGLAALSQLHPQEAQAAQQKQKGR